MKHIKKFNENGDFREKPYYMQDESNTKSSHTSLICPYCNFEQDEVPENILSDESNFSEGESGSSEFGSYSCEECNEPFEFVKQIEVTYTSFKTDSKSGKRGI